MLTELVAIPERNFRSCHHQVVREVVGLLLGDLVLFGGQKAARCLLHHRKLLTRLLGHDVSPRSLSAFSLSSLPPLGGLSRDRTDTPVTEGRSWGPDRRQYSVTACRTLSWHSNESCSRCTRPGRLVLTSVPEVFGVNISSHDPKRLRSGPDSGGRGVSSRLPRGVIGRSRVDLWVGIGPVGTGRRSTRGEAQ